MWLEQQATTANEHTKAYLTACISNLKSDLGLDKKEDKLYQDPELVKSLQVVFPEREAKVLSLLNNNTHLPVSAMYRYLEYDRQSMYRILDSFVEKEICTKVTGDITSYAFIHPDSPFDGLIHYKQKEIDNLKKINHIMKEKK